MRSLHSNAFQELLRLAARTACPGRLHWACYQPASPSASLLAEGLLQQVVVPHIRRWAHKYDILLSYFLLSSNLEPVEKGLAIDTCFRPRGVPRSSELIVQWHRVGKETSTLISAAWGVHIASKRNAEITFRESVEPSPLSPPTFTKPLDGAGLRTGVR